MISIQNLSMQFTGEGLFTDISILKTYVGSCEYNHDPDCERTLT